MKKIFFAGFVQLCIQTSLACTPGAAGTGPAGDPHCLLPMIHNDPYYNGSNTSSPPPRKTKPKVIYIKKPDSWGAIAVAKSSGKGEPNRLYSSLEHESKAVAKNAAVRDCKAKNNKFCKYLIVWSNGCAAVAEGQNAQGFFNLFPNSKETAAEAEESVLGLCKKDGHTDCKIIVPAQCSLPK